MKKLFVALATIISISSFAEAAKIVIKNNSIYNVSYGTSYLAVANPLGTSISSGQYVIFDLPDNVQSKVYVRRWSLEGAVKNVWSWGKRLYTAVAPSKENAADFAKEVYRFGGKEVYDRLAVAKTNLNPSLVAEQNIKVINIENSAEGTDTIEMTTFDDLIINYPGIVMNTEATPALVPALVIEDVKNEVEVVELLESTSLEDSDGEEPAIEEID